MGQELSLRPGGEAAVIRSDGLTAGLSMGDD